MKKAFTLLELLVVVLILGLLSTIAVGVFTTQVERAKYSAARATISAIELAIERYQIDLGEFPPSGSGPLNSAPGSISYEGCGLLQLALQSSLSGKSTQPGSVRWQGPYITIKNDLLGNIQGQRLDDPGLTAIPLPGQVQILDPWQSPYRYVRSKSLINPDTDFDRYENNFGTLLPSNHPFAATETYYNPNTFQIVSPGPDGVSGAIQSHEYGRQTNDVTNFGL